MWTINNFLLAMTVAFMLSLLGQYKPSLKLPNYVPILIGVGIYFSLKEGWLILPGYIGYVGLAAIIIFYGIPYALGRSLMRADTERDWKQAQKYARWISWLNPSIEWSKAPLLYQALELMDQDDTPAAAALLQQLQSVKGTWISGFARRNLYRIHGRWSELVRELQPAPDAEIQPHNLVLYLEALAETGDLNGLVEGFQRYQPALKKLDDNDQRHAYVFLFAFVGRPDLVHRAIDPIKHTLTPNRVSFMETTADLVAGNPLPIRDLIESLHPSISSETRGLFERRMNHPPPSPATLTAENKARLLEIEQGWGGYIGPAKGRQYAFGKRP